MHLILARPNGTGFVISLVWHLTLHSMISLYTGFAILPCVYDLNEKINLIYIYFVKNIQRDVPKFRGDLPCFYAYYWFFVSVSVSSASVISVVSYE